MDRAFSQWRAAARRVWRIMGKSVGWAAPVARNARKRPKTTMSIGALATTAATVFMLGWVVGDWFDEFADLRGPLTSAPRTPEGELTYGEPGPPPLEVGDRLTSVGVKLGALTGPIMRRPAPTRALPGGYVVLDYRDLCNRAPRSQHERNSKPTQTITLHTTEEMAGVDALCRHCSGLYDRSCYNYYITQSGETHQLLDDGVKPYAQKLHNDGDVSIALQGRTNVNAPSAAQTRALERLYDALARLYPLLDPDDIYDHGDWTDADQARLRAGTWSAAPAYANDHTDIGQGWAALKPRLAAVVANVRRGSSAGLPPTGGAPSPPPNPEDKPAAATGVTRGYWVYPAPNRATGASVDGQATYYADQFDGGVTASGVVFSQANPRQAATYLTGDGERLRPAWLFGTWVRVTNRAGGASLDVEIVDTGGTKPGDARQGFGPPHIIDLSQSGFARLAPLARGRLDVRVTVMHTPPDTGGPDPCDYVPDTGYTVCQGFRDPYRANRAAYGLPTGPMGYHADGTVSQPFQRGWLTWTPASGVVWQAD